MFTFAGVVCLVETALTGFEAVFAVEAEGREVGGRGGAVDDEVAVVVSCFRSFDRTESTTSAIDRIDALSD